MMVYILAYMAFCLVVWICIGISIHGANKNYKRED